MDRPLALLGVESRGFARMEMRSSGVTRCKSPWSRLPRCLKVSFVGPVLGLQGKSPLTKQGRYRFRWGLGIRQVLGTETQD